MNKLNYLWKPIYLWLKYFLIVIIGKDPVIELNNGVKYSIHPQSVRGLCLNLDAVEFLCCISGIPVHVELLWEDIKQFKGE